MMVIIMKLQELGILRVLPRARIMYRHFFIIHSTFGELWMILPTVVVQYRESGDVE